MLVNVWYLNLDDFLGMQKNIRLVLDFEICWGMSVLIIEVFIGVC